MERTGLNGVRVSLRLCFVKLPGTNDRRIFRDVMLLREPEDKSFQDLSDIVEKKLAFMEIPPADFTVLHTENNGAGDRVVVDDAYFSELVEGWFRQLYARLRQQRKTSGKGAPTEDGKRDRTGVSSHTGSFSQEAQPLTLLGGSPDKQDHTDTEVGPTTNADSVASSSSASSSDSDGSGSHRRRGGLLEIAVTFDVEVNRLRNTGTATTTAGATGNPLEHRTYSGGSAQSGLARHTPGVPSPTSQPSPGVNGPAALGASNATPTCVPLTVQNLTAVMKSGGLAAPAAGAAAVTTVTTAAPVVTATTALPDRTLRGEVLVRVGDLVCPPATPHFYLRCVAVDIRFKMPKPGLSIGEIDLCDVADPRQVITGVTFDASVQKEMKESLRCDGRQVLELRHVFVRRKNELDMRYATNSHPLLLRIDRSSKLEVVQVLTVPILSRAPVVSATEDAVISFRDRTNSMRTGGGIVELTDLSRHPRTGGGLLGSAVASSDVGVGLPCAGNGLSSSSSSSTGARRTTFTLGSGNNTVGPSGGGAGVSGVVPSAYGSQLRQQQQQLLSQAALAQRQLLQQQQLPYEPGVIPVTLRDVRAREALVEQHASRETKQKERIRRRLEVSQACILCGLDLSEGKEEVCMAMVRRLLEASYRNKGLHIPSHEQLHDALCDRRPLLMHKGNTADQRAWVSDGPAKGGTSNGRRRPTRLTCQQTFVNLQTRANHVVHCRCAHLCTEYQNGGSLEDIAWCELPMQTCSLCGLPGAFVACYHPDCKEVYHSVCALFSQGYVNFGKKDPFLPCPACPRHTQVILTHGAKKQKGTSTGTDVLHVDESCWADEDIAFDSRVVAAGDLRDPDENDGE